MGKKVPERGGSFEWANNWLKCSFFVKKISVEHNHKKFMPRGNPQNLQKHQWKKGQSGNPKGRPKNMPDLKEALMTVLGQIQNDTNALEAMLTVLRSKALKGDTKAAEILLDRAYGKPKQETDVMATFTQVIMPLPPAQDVIEIGHGNVNLEIEESPEKVKQLRDGDNS
jgi:hypothetical protein